MGSLNSPGDQWYKTVNTQASRLLSEKAQGGGACLSQQLVDVPFGHEREQAGDPGQGSAPTRGTAGDSPRPEPSSVGASACSPGDGVTLSARAGLLLRVPGALLPPSGRPDSWAYT